MAMQEQDNNQELEHKPIDQANDTSVELSNTQQNKENNNSKEENSFLGLTIVELTKKAEGLLHQSEENLLDNLKHLQTAFAQKKEALEHKTEQITDATLEKLELALASLQQKKEQKEAELQKANQQAIEQRKEIIERLKNLYSGNNATGNLFKEIRSIKDQWQSAGLVQKNDFKNLSNDYFHHLGQFYKMLELNKEYREQEYIHNLEKRQHIISRAKELIVEPLVQKALNELQYLHKLWKEEAEPVAEEFREKTWEEFKEISNKVHERKAELLEQLEQSQQKNLEEKNHIIEKIKKLTTPEKKPAHSYWQSAIEKVEKLRSEFIAIGSVSKKESNQNWTHFKDALRDFNAAKNEFYKSLKKTQSDNLEKKKLLIKTAQDNQHSEDWETAVALFKTLQQQWKQIGHVPKNQTNKIWDEFRDACNVFFDKFRQETSEGGNDDWKENYKQKRSLLDELTKIEQEENSIERINTIKNQWNSIGKVPKDKLAINGEFNKTLKAKLKINKIQEFELADDNLSESQLTDKARKIKNQISDLSAEIAKLENNIAFFSNPSRQNPLLAPSYQRVDEKKEQMESLKNKLHQIINSKE